MLRLFLEGENKETRGIIWVVNERGETLLHRAVLANAAKIVEYLLTFNLDVNQKDKAKLTPLHCAVMTLHLPLVKTLI